MANRNIVFEAVKNELEYQRRIGQNGSNLLGIWMAILTDRMGKAAAASLAGNPEQCKQEILTVAAVAVATLEDHGLGTKRDE